MKYGPFSLSDAVSGTITLKTWLNSESSFDYLQWLVSINGTNYYGSQTSGNQSGSGFVSRSIDLTSVPTLGNVCGQSQVWFAVRFYSDGSNQYEGAYVDDIVITKTTGTPDLYDDGQSYSGFSPTTVTAGQSGQAFSPYCDVRNGGNLASGSFAVDFYASTDATINTSDYYIGRVNMGSIAATNWANCDWSGNFPTGIPSGTYYIGWIIDAIGAVAESNEGNNITYKTAYTLTVQPPLPSITSYTPSGSFSVPQGFSFTLNYAVNNPRPGENMILGASIIHTSTGTNYSDPANDTTVFVGTGGFSFSRIFNVPMSIPTGTYTVQWGLHNSSATQMYDLKERIGILTVASQNDLGLGIDASNSIASPTGLAPLPTITGNGQVSTLDADDYYGLYLYAGEKLQVTLVPPPSTNCDLWLYNASNTVVDSSIGGTGVTEYIPSSTAYYNITSDGNWKARADQYSGSGTYSLTIKLLPMPPALTSPASGDTKVPINAALGWNLSGSGTVVAAKYFVQISTSPSFATITAENNNLGATTTSWAPPGGLAAGTTYYWRVAAGNANGFGDWSPSRSFTTPPAITSYTPSTAFTVTQGDSLTLLYSVNNPYAGENMVLGASIINTSSDTTYSDPGNDTAVFIAGGVTSPGLNRSFNVSTTVPAGTYTVQWGLHNSSMTEMYDLKERIGVLTVVSQNDMGTGSDASNSIAGATDTVETASVSGTGQLLVSDADDYYAVELFAGEKLQLTLTPPPSTDFDLRLYNPGNTQVDQSINGTGAADYIPSSSPSAFYNIATSGTWKVHVRRWSGTGTYNLTIKILPLPPTLVSPFDGTTGHPINALLNWNISDSGPTVATKYHVQISTSSSFSTIFAENNNVIATSWTPPTLALGTTYYWRVRAGNMNGYGDWETTWSFRTATLPDLQPTRVALYASRYFPEDNITFDINVRNNGDMASGTYVARLFLSTVADYSTASDISLGDIALSSVPGLTTVAYTKTISLPYTLPGGVPFDGATNYYLTALVNPSQTITEINYNNNVAYSTDFFGFSDPLRVDNNGVIHEVHDGTSTDIYFNPGSNSSLTLHWKDNTQGFTATTYSSMNDFEHGGKEVRFAFQDPTGLSTKTALFFDNNIQYPDKASLGNCWWAVRYPLRYDPTATGDPILFVHGIGTEDYGHLSYWNGIPEILAQTGAYSQSWQLFYPQREAISRSSDWLGQAIQYVLSKHPNAFKVTVVCHSAGGLVTRNLIQSNTLISNDKVGRALFLSPVLHGSHQAMRILNGEPAPSSWLYNIVWSSLYNGHTANEPIITDLATGNILYWNLNATKSLLNSKVGPGNMAVIAGDITTIAVAGDGDEQPPELVEGSPTQNAGGNSGGTNSDGYLSCAATSLMDLGVPLYIADGHHGSFVNNHSGWGSDPGTMAGIIGDWLADGSITIGGHIRARYASTSIAPGPLRGNLMVLYTGSRPVNEQPLRKDPTGNGSDYYILKDLNGNTMPGYLNNTTTRPDVSPTVYSRMAFYFDEYPGAPSNPHEGLSLSPGIYNLYNTSGNLLSAQPFVIAAGQTSYYAVGDSDLNPLPPPTITAQPQNQTVNVGQAALFTITASSPVSITYQWQRNASNIAGATASSYCTSATVAGDHGTMFRCIVSNAAGSAVSNSVSVTVISPPTITSNPINQTVNIGQTATFSVNASGIGLGYQWQKDGVNISGATGTSYLTPPTVAGNNGAQFCCVVTNSAGSTTTNSATLTVITPPTITANPTNQTVNFGQSATFSVAATGLGTVTYQWQRDSVNIAGATSSTYTTPSTGAGDNGGQFRCLVSNSAGTTTSNIATLTIVTPPAIAAQPVDQTVNVGQPATFSVSVSGIGLGYQWQKNGVNISGATGISYSTPPTVAGDNGAQFRCGVINSAGSTTSSSAILTVICPPAITANTTNPTVNIGQSATFSVTATGLGLLTYQWQRNGENIPGAASASYTTPGTIPADNGAQFHCVVSNSAGSTTSNSATLTITYILNVTSGTGGGNYTSGAIVSVVANAPGTGQVFDRWTGDTTSLLDVNAASTTLTMPALNVSLTATYKVAPPLTFTLAVNSGVGDGNYLSGSSVAIVADAAPPGQMFDKWTGHTTGIVSIFAANTTLPMPAAYTVLTATFKDLPHSISGRVTDGTNGLAGFTVSDGTRSAQTEATGNYTLPGVPDGVYTLTPSLSGYTFAPATRLVMVAGASIYGQDFTASAVPPPNVPPAILSGPDATPNPATVNQAVLFSAVATDAQTFSYAWNFGDQTGDATSTPNPSHTYTAAGSYTVTLSVTDALGLTSVKTLALTVAVATGGGTPGDMDGDGDPDGIDPDNDNDGFLDEIEQATGTDPNDGSSTPWGGDPAGTPTEPAVNNLQVKLNFATTNKDSVMVAGSFPVSAGVALENQQVIVDIGGMVKLFTLDANGSNTAKSATEAFKLRVKANSGVENSSTASFSAKFKAGNYADEFADEGLANATVGKPGSSLQIPVIVMFNRQFFRLRCDVTYTAKENKKGMCWITGP